MAKGAAWEREVCHMLSLWWTNQTDSEVFWRTSNSGGRATVRAKAGKKLTHSYSDICAVDPIGQPLIDLLTIETKRGYQRDTLHDLLDKGSRAAEQTYERWLDKVRADHEAADTFGFLLITRRNQRDAIVVTESYTLQKLIGGYAGIWPRAEFVLPRSGWCNTYVIVRLSDFFNVVEPARVTRLAKKYKKNRQM